MQNPFEMKLSQDFYNENMIQGVRYQEARRQNESFRYNHRLIETAEQVSHDIRSPLSALTMIIGSLDETQIAEKQIILDTARRINEIAGRLLKLRKSLHFPVRETAPQCSLIPTLTDLFGELLVISKNEEVDLVIDNTASNASVALDSGDLKSILSNLFHNSLHAVKAKRTAALGKITFTIREFKKVVELQISDDGVGIPEEILPRLGKERFSYGKELCDDAGSGIGFFSAKKMLEKYGGKLSISSRLGAGTTVQMILKKS